MKVLITGASGFLGKNLVSKFITEGWEVITIVRPTSDYKQLEETGVHLIFGDLRDPKCITEATQGVDLIVHAAANMRGTWDDYYQINVKSTELLLEQARKLGFKKFIFISSIIVYEHFTAPSGTLFSEDMPYESKNLTDYARSKIEAEKIVQHYYKKYKIPAVIIRPGALFGPGGPLYPARLGYSLGKFYLVIGNGKLQLPLSHVKSVTEAIWNSIQTDKSSGRCYNVVDDTSITQLEFLHRVKKIAHPELKILKMPYILARMIAQLLQIMFKFLGRTSPIRIPSLKLCSTQFYYSNQRAKEELNWQPISNFDQSINEMLISYAESRKPKRFVPLVKGRVEVPTQQKLNVGIVGCGMFAETHLSILKRFKNANVMALCDLNEKARHQLAKKFKIPNTYSSLKDMLEKERLDVVHIVTPAQTHYQLTMEALKHKVHVLVEKPVAVNAKEAKKMFQFAKKQKVKLCVDHNHVFDEVMIKARQLLAQGVVGKIAHVESWYATSYSSNSNSRYLKYEARNHWVYQLPGSLYQNMISHPISLLIDVMGEVKEIKAVTKYLQIVPHMDSDELRALITNDEMIGTLTMSLAVSPRYHFVNIYGTKGTLKIDFLNKYIFHDKVVPMVPKVISRNLMIWKHGWLSLFSTLRNFVNVLRGQYSLFEGNERLIHLFYRSILLNEKMPISPEEAIQSMEIMDEIWKQIKLQGTSSNNHKQQKSTDLKKKKKSEIVIT